jgi:hypothetical protein
MGIMYPCRMLLKAAENRTDDIATLKALLKEPELAPVQMQAITSELENMEKGAWGEHHADYFLNIYFAESEKHLILHDLQVILSDDRIAHIDHVLVNSFQHFYLFESRNWAKLNVNKDDVCTTEYDRVIDTESPLDEAKRHATILARAIQLDPALKTLAPRAEIHPRVLVAPKCRLTAPFHEELYVKSDMFCAQKTKDSRPTAMMKNVFDLPRLTTHKTLEKIGEALLGLHNPKKTDWRHKFGLAPLPPKDYITAEQLLATIEGLAALVPRSYDNWLQLNYPPGHPPMLILKQLRDAGYRPNKVHGEWIWSFYIDVKPDEPEAHWM